MPPEEAREFFARPILRVRDVRASVAYYCDALGFTKEWEHGAGDTLIIAQVSRRGIDVILDAASVLPRPGSTSVLALSADERLGAVHQELAGRGAKITRAPFEVVWQAGVYQFDVEDLDGNVLIFWGAAPS